MIDHDLQILVIDHCTDYAGEVQHNLEQKTNKHVNIVVEPDVEKAMTAMSDSEFDVILASWEAVHHKRYSAPVNADGHTPPVVGIIESGNSDDVQHNGVVKDFLVKMPVQPDLLSQMILNTIENHKLRASLHNSENDFRKLLDKNADSILVVDSSGTLLYSNAAATQMFGHVAPKEGEVFGIPVTAGETTELDIISKTGERTVAEMRVVDIDWNGSSACLATLRDVTVRKTTEESLEKRVRERTLALESANDELRKMYETANKAAQVRAQFIANFSHEVRTPLGGVVSAAELLPMADSIEEFRELANHVAASSKLLLNVVESILDFSKLESGSMPVNDTDFSVGDLVESILKSIEKSATKNKVTLHAEVDSEIPALIKADALKIRQVLMNLAHNAVKFTKNGKVTVYATIEKTDSPDDDDTLKVTVKDSGIGMSPTECEQIFQPFVQGNATIHQNFGGTGLGLSICKQLIDAMSGNISCCSEEGHGSTFWFTVPVKASSLGAN